MINLENFNEAFKYIGNEVVVQIIDMFLEEHKEDMMLIEEGILNNDLSNLKFHAHHLKGSIAIFMDAETTELAGKLEEMAENQSNDELPETFAELQVAVKELVCELQNKRNELLP
jgi:HPt (histidine-containing phosphotransfer) domain-containing protein